MTTREEWLNAAYYALRDDPHLRRVTMMDAPTILPSFPGRSTRSVMLGDIARHEDNPLERVYLVSPLIASSTEVSVVLYWLMVRHAARYEDARRMTTRRVATTMTAYGFSAPHKACVPQEYLVDRIAQAIAPLIDSLGEYPSQEVRLAARATQTTRLLKVECTLHREPYILRMSQKQFDRGAPSCGICHARMSLA